MGLGGNLGWNSGIRMIRSEPRRKPRMKLFQVAEVKGQVWDEVSLRSMFPPLRSSCIRMIRPEPRRKARMEMRSSKVSESCGGIELIRMIRMEPRRKPRMEIINPAMKLGVRKI